MTRTQALRMAKANKARKERNIWTLGDGQHRGQRYVRVPVPALSREPSPFWLTQDRMRANLHMFAHREGWLQ